MQGNMQELSASDPDDREMKLVLVQVTGESTPFPPAIIYGKQSGRI